MANFKSDNMPGSSVSHYRSSGNGSNAVTDSNVSSTIMTNLDDREQELVNQICSNLYSEKTKRDHNHRIKTFILFLEEKI